MSKKGMASMTDTMMSSQIITKSINKEYEASMRQNQNNGLGLKT